ncbi:MAG: hypothetical protein Q4D33_12545, partial [Prevotellaceae bacterium]|nr:hypothetical protein [Prevotellaceae bacterium]
QGINLVGAQNGHTYLGVARSKKNAEMAFSTLFSLANVIYVNLHGITSPEDIAKYTFDGKTAYPAGNDSNDGKTPATAVKTMARAIALAMPSAQKVKLADNVIVIMGDYDENVLTSFFDDEMTQPNAKAIAGYKYPLIVSGAYGNLRNGAILMSGESILLTADTRFENITFHCEPGKRGSATIYAQNNDLTFGYGIKMEDYAMMDFAYGIAEGAHSPM